MLYLSEEGKERVVTALPWSISFLVSISLNVSTSVTVLKAESIEATRGKSRFSTNLVSLGIFPSTESSFGEEASLRNFEYKLCNMKKESNQLFSQEKARKCDKDYDSQNVRNPMAFIKRMKIPSSHTILISNTVSVLLLRLVAWNFCTNLVHLFTSCGIALAVMKAVGAI